MQPTQIGSIQGTVFNVHLKSIIDPEHELSILSKKIDWDYFHKEFSSLFKGKTGKPPKSVRLIIGLMILELTFLGSYFWCFIYVDKFKKQDMLIYLS